MRSPKLAEPPSEAPRVACGEARTSSAVLALLAAARAAIITMLRLLLGGFVIAFIFLYAARVQSPMRPIAIRPLQQPLQPLQSTSPSVLAAEAVSTIDEVRAHRRAVIKMLRRSDAAEAELQRAIDMMRAERTEIANEDAANAKEEVAAAKAEANAAATAVAAEPASPPLAAGKACPAGCTKHGNCMNLGRTDALN